MASIDCSSTALRQNHAPQLVALAGGSREDCGKVVGGKLRDAIGASRQVRNAVVLAVRRSNPARSAASGSATWKMDTSRNSAARTQLVFGQVNHGDCLALRPGRRSETAEAAGITSVGSQVPRSGHFGLLSAVTDERGCVTCRF